VIGSGSTGKPKEMAGGEQEWDFKWDKPGFPGTIIAGKFDAPVSGAAPNIHVYTTPAHKAATADYASTALREFAYFTSTFGIPESTQLNVVELPDDTVPVFWAPEIAAVAGNHIGGKNDFSPAGQHYRPPVVGQRSQPLLPERRLDHHGMARYGELMYLEDDAGHSALESRPSGHRRQRSGLRHHPAFQRRHPRRILPSVPVHDAR